MFYRSVDMDFMSNVLICGSVRIPHVRPVDRSWWSRGAGSVASFRRFPADKFRRRRNIKVGNMIQALVQVIIYHDNFKKFGVIFVY